MKLLVLISLLCLARRSYGNPRLHKRESTNKQSLIVGGQQSTMDQHAGLAHLYIRSRNLKDSECDSTILSTIYVLSAANCFDGNVFDIMIVVGATTIGKRLTIGSPGVATKHPKYKPGSINFDIAVVTSKRAFILGPNVKPITLIDGVSKIRAGQRLTIVGWSSDTTTAVRKLEEITLEVKDFGPCKNNYDRLNIVISSLSFCAGAPTGLSGGACDSYAGSPAIIAQVQVGIVSHSKRCSTSPDADNPVIFTNIAPLRGWIKKMTKI